MGRWGGLVGQKFLDWIAPPKKLSCLDQLIAVGPVTFS